MKTSEFDYELDPGRIAQTPLEPRDASRLMVVQRAEGNIVHRRFCDIGDYLAADDLLVFNESRVIPARLFARKLLPPRPGEAGWQEGGRVELLLLKRCQNDSSHKDIPQGHPTGTSHRDIGTMLGRCWDDAGTVWRALVRGKRVRQGTRLALVEPKSGARTGIEATVLQVGELGERVLAFEPGLDVGAALEQIGVVPLPPYIHETLDDAERYQTVYARWPGSAAAPTAGLHFTPELLLSLRQRGVRFGFVTLHIGLDTFRPVSVEQIQEHHMHSEFFVLDAPTCAQVNQARLAGRNIVAVGTTVVRVLESAAQKTLARPRLSSAEASVEPTACASDGACALQTVAAYEGPTDLFITPGYRFRVVDRLITNFHLPRSTLLMLVSAFAGLDLARQAYQAAIENDYRFYSFGDAMLIL